MSAECLVQSFVKRKLSEPISDSTNNSLKYLEILGTNSDLLHVYFVYGKYLLRPQIRF